MKRMIEIDVPSRYLLPAIYAAIREQGGDVLAVSVPPAEVDPDGPLTRRHTFGHKPGECPGCADR